MRPLPSLDSPDLSQLNAAQREAVCHPGGPLLILAGAGSGKTRVLTFRVAHLLSRGLPPYRILAVTFTNKAAEEMGTRLHKLVGPEASRGLWLGTFHALCGRILRMELPRCPVDLGIRSNYVIFDQDEQKHLILECLKELNKDPKRFSPWKVQGTISAAKNRSLTAEAFASRATDYWQQVVSEVFLLYQEKLRRNNALDFDDLLLVTLELFRRDPAVLQNYRERFLHLLVDEYQDTNPVQYQLVKDLGAGHRNVCVVGDVDQSIYGFRGADYRILLNFERDFPDAHRIVLQENYRSSGTILEAANHLIENNRERYPKVLVTRNPTGEKITAFEALDEREEAAFVLREVERLTGRGHDYRDIAVLYRINAQSRPFEEACKYQHIPYRLIGGISFFERKEIKDVLAYLRVLYNPDDALALHRIINTPRRGIGTATVDRLIEVAESSGRSPWEVLGYPEGIPDLSLRGRQALGQFHGWMQELRAQADRLSLSQLLELVLERSGYWQYLTSDQSLENFERQENVRELQAVARECEEQAEDANLGTFLTQMALMTSADDPESGTLPGGGAITLMTLHGAKGLEFPVIFLVGMEENLFPHSRSLSDSGALEEERRLCYVGITRAQQRLCITWAQNRMTYAGPTQNRRSRFVDEVPETLFAQIPEQGSGARGQGSGRRDRKKPSSWTSVEDGQGTWDQQPDARLQHRGTEERMPPADGFSVGDLVTHPDHGPGTVVQVLGTGPRLCLAIVFERQPGRKRLIDPALSGIQRL